MDGLPVIQIIIASTRRQRRGSPIAAWSAGVAARRDDLVVDVADLAELALPFLADATPRMGAASRDPAAREWAERVAAADGYVVVTPEYNHGYPAPLKNALDHLFGEWGRKPIAFVSYGATSGGARAVEQLRQVAVELDMVPIRRQIAIARIWAALGEDGACRSRRRAGTWRDGSCIAPRACRSSAARSTGSWVSRRGSPRCGVPRQA